MLALVDGPSTDDTSVTRADVELVQCQLRPHGEHLQHQADVATTVPAGVHTLAWRKGPDPGEQLLLIVRVVRPETSRQPPPGHIRITRTSTGTSSTYASNAANGFGAAWWSATSL